MTTTKLENVIAVDSSDGAGAATWWRLTEVDREAFCAALRNIGIPDRMLPSAIEDKAALQRALEYHIAKGRKLKVVAFEDVDGFVVEGTKAHGGNVEHWTVAKVVLKDGDLHCWECGADVARMILTAFETERGKLDGYDVGMWLSNRVLPSLHAVPLRDKGGIYFVPPSTIQRWQAVAGAITECAGGKVFELPAMECDKAVDAILDAVSREAEQAIQKMEDQLINDDLGATALKNRVSKLDKLLSKVTGYETMLGTSIQGLHERAEALSAQMAAAILTAETKSDEQEAA